MTDKASPPQQTRSVEDFLKAVYVLQQQTERVSTNALADMLGISAPSVTDMARRMVEARLVDYRKYYGVRLTAKGEAIALHVIRRHRLIELYLVEKLGYELHEVHDEAENMEHAVSDRFVEAIAAELGHPEVDPHGDPIPTPEGQMHRPQLMPLTELPDDTPARVSRFVAESAEMLQHMTDRAFSLGATVRVLRRDPFDGPLIVEVNDEEQTVGHNVAACILVDVTDDNPGNE